MFIGILRQQLVLKGIITDSDWLELFHNRVRIDYYKDNHYTELKDAEVFRERLGLMDQASQYVGEYVSKSWVMKNVFRFNEDEIEAMELEIQNEGPTEDEPAGDDDGN